MSASASASESDAIPEIRIPPVNEVFADERLRQAAAAAEAGDVEQIRAIGRVNLDTMQPLDVNLLMYEIAAKNETAVRTLLDAGADPNFLTPDGGSPMLFAATNEDLTWLGILLDKGGDPDLRNAFGEPLLTLLAYKNRWEAIVLLLDRGAPIDAVGMSAETVTFRMGALHQFDHVYELLERGADPTRGNVNRITLRDFVKQPVPPGSPQEPWQKRVAERLK